LVISLPTRNSANFLERKNERLLNQLMPDWTRRATASPDAMLATMLLASDGGLTLLQYQAASSAATTKPTTKPRVYIVH
jgi:hypothetical protein